MPIVTFGISSPPSSARAHTPHRKAMLSLLMAMLFPESTRSDIEADKRDRCATQARCGTFDMREFSVCAKTAGVRRVDA